MRMMKRLLRAAGLLGLAAALWLAMLWLLSWEHGMTAEDAAPLTALYLCAWGMALAFRRQGRSRRRGARIAWGLAGTALSVVLWLGLTLALFVASILTAAGSERLGNFLHGVLAIVSTPMLCSGQWALSLFLWACLLMLSLKKRGKPPVESDSTAG